MRYFLGCILLLQACGGNSGPDVSNIKADVSTKHFEQDLFKADAGKIVSQMPALTTKYPTFTPSFFGTILNADPNWNADTLQTYVSGFLKEYRPVYDSSEKLYKDFSKYSNEIVQGLKHVKYYFPQYRLPTQIITYVGPIDGYGDILDENSVIVGLQHHLGSGSSFYKSMWVEDVYPEYITRRFTADYIAINAMKNIVLDIYPEKNEDKSLVLQMVENGKRLYVLQKLLPDVSAYQIIGYTKKQYDETLDHEKSIWALFVQNNLLRSQDYNLIKNYIGDSPKTQELGEASPGNIGSFAGWQIVKAYISKNESVTPAQLLATDPEKIFSEARYKP